MWASEGDSPSYEDSVGAQPLGNLHVLQRSCPDEADKQRQMLLQAGPLSRDILSVMVLQ